MPDARDGWLEVLDDLDKKHQGGHDRLRLDLRELERRVENNYQHFDTIVSLHRSKIATLEATVATPVDATKLVLSTKAIVAVVVSCLAIAASYWSLSAKFDSQQKLTDIQIVSLRDEVRQTRSEAIDAARQSTARTELLRIEVQSLKETVISKKAGQ